MATKKKVHETDAGRARVRRFGIDPDKIGEAEARKLKSVGIHPDTFERHSVTWDGLIEEFGRPAGPQLYNAIAVAGWGGVPASRQALALVTLDDAHAREDIDPGRAQKRVARRERVKKLLAEAEKEA